MAWPLRILAVPAALAGLLNAPGVLLFHHWVEFEVPGVQPFLESHPFNPGLALVSLTFAVLGIGVASGYYLRNAWPRGAMDRMPALKTGYRILVNKYYLDNLYIDGVVRKIQYPVARAAYWINQNVIDGVVNAFGVGARSAGQLVYDVIDQKGIDGIVNGAGLGAEEGGSILRRTQTGRVQQYAALLFGATALLAAGLVFLT
jgi:NADH-quinone oxidoreductase subunit L